ncbi:MAG: adenosylmethionine decarboxylase [Spirochaetes bacterium]|nr:adenosylmethionine decarboxylase [Spirochaetota bacterium]
MASAKRKISETKSSQSLYEKKRKRIKLHGFNNLTKSLSFNIYDISYTPSAQSRREYLEYIDEVYNSERLYGILEKVVEIIGAHIISTSTQDYDPLGASATILISEEPVRASNTVMHLDKSHVTAHTYPESDEHTNLSTFRVDIDVATCGKISPLNALDYLIGCFDSDVVSLDYKVRGFTRDVHGTKHFIDHSIFSILDFIGDSVLNRYRYYETNNYQDNLFHAKMILKDFKIDDYLFRREENISDKSREKVERLIQKQMEDIFYSSNTQRRKTYEQ